MGDKEKDIDVDAELLAAGREFDKDAEIDRILSVFKLNAYAVLDLTPGVPESDIKKTYRNKSLLIHPDKTPNPKAPEAFDRLKKAQSTLMDEKARTELDEHIADARMLLMRERKLTADDEETRDEEFAKAWREKTTWVIMDNEKRKKRQMEAQMREEGRQQRKEEEEIAERKRKRDHEDAWEKTRDVRINSWRDFQNGKKPDAEGGKKKKKKIKALG
ncbi:DnaJ-domain-containing protein [Trematosphaeria pertusa]|uniref:DnaJ-domain-containing protein n=1 Tax=Trematosphaeria pertusa TaxID=390896 RepID=A0A6A6IYN5_9PLEO|nr:DnaJ-domain-containing protein [Trematosphaeria pertusa]KAF2255681.1 DnaJ-domain-containing protein [Trematosphaeria pertusa]